MTFTPYQYQSLLFTDQLSSPKLRNGCCKSLTSLQWRVLHTLVFAPPSHSKSYRIPKYKSRLRLIRTGLTSASCTWSYLKSTTGSTKCFKSYFCHKFLLSLKIHRWVLLRVRSNMYSVQNSWITSPSLKFDSAFPPYWIKYKANDS